MVNLRQLGQTDFFWSPIGLGTWQFSNRGGTWKTVTDDLVYDILKATLQDGINWLDTAEVYGRGISEQFIGKTLQRLKREQTLDYPVYIADKWFPFLRTATTIPKALKTQLNYLQVPSIDLYQIHQPTSVSSLQRQVEELAKLVENGFIKAIGVSNFTAKQMERTDDLLRKVGLTLASNQVKYNLLHRNPEKNGVLTVAKERNISIIAYSPLQQGLLTGRFHDDPGSIQAVSRLRRLSSGISRSRLEQTEPLINLLKQLALTYDKSPAQIALNWLIHSQGNTVFTIPGASSVQQARSNLKAQSFTLSPEDIQLLNSLT